MIAIDFKQDHFDFTLAQFDFMLLEEVVASFIALLLGGIESDHCQID
jgi:hypothetical protein